MNLRILTTRVSAAHRVTLRDRTRQIAELFGLDELQRTRFITAVSEIARNTVQYAGEGTATFTFGSRPDQPGAQEVVVLITDKGPGIADLRAVLAGRPNAGGRVGMGIRGSQRLVDRFTIDQPAAGGVVVTLAMTLPRGAPVLSGATVAERVDRLARRRPQTPMEELELQNREMLRTLDELRVQQTALQLADERKNQFLATLAHELRNPLGTLVMTLELMRRHPDLSLDAVAARREVMSRQTDQLTRLVEDLLDVSRVSEGKVSLDVQATEVNALAGEALEMAGAALQSKQHEVLIRPAGEPLWVQGDKARLKQVLCNLLHNAARYTPPKGRIEIAVRRESSYAVIDVIDNGIGIGQDLLPHVFDLFVQGDPAGPEGGGGLGVGLTLVQRLVQEHGGTVSAASGGAGLGSRFMVALPLSSSSATMH